MVAHSSEFENIVVREEEQPELLQLRDRFCPLEVKGGMEDKIGKVNVLIQVEEVSLSLFPLSTHLLHLTMFCFSRFTFLVHIWMDSLSLPIAHTSVQVWGE